MFTYLRTSLLASGMFSAADVGQMMWHSDSDDGKMNGGSDVEVDDYVSSFFLTLL